MRSLRTFCVAAHHMSFREAADTLFVTASAVSHQIKSLEQEVGGELFDRSSRTLTLTPLGKSLYEEIRPLLEQLDDVVSRYAERAPRRKLRVSVQPFFASEFFVPRLGEFTRSHPDIDLQLSTSDESSERHPTDADLSIRLFRSEPQGLSHDLLFPLRLVPAASAGYAKTVRVKGKALEGDLTLIVHDIQPKAWENWRNQTGFALPDDVRFLRLDSMIAIARAAEQGVGAALMPVPLADRWFESGSLVRLVDAELLTDLSYYLVSTPDQAKSNDVRSLRDWILKSFSAGS